MCVHKRLDNDPLFQPKHERIPGAGLHRIRVHLASRPRMTCQKPAVIRPSVRWTRLAESEQGGHGVVVQQLGAVGIECRVEHVEAVTRARARAAEKMVEGNHQCLTPVLREPCSAMTARWLRSRP